MTGWLASLQIQARKTVARIAVLLGSLARWLAEWAGMHKRLEIVVRNPGYEGTDVAMGTHILDFHNETSLAQAKQNLARSLRVTSSQIERTVIIVNEDDEHLGFNPDYYVSHRIADVEAWTVPRWESLPADGNPAPERES